MFSLHRSPWIALLPALLLALALRAPVADIPLERDEGEYAYIAARLFHGEIPYRDSFDQKPPGVFVIYALILKTLGATPRAIHWGAQFYSLGTLAAIFALGRVCFGTGPAAIASCLAAVLMADPTMLGNAANTETFMLLPMTLALLAVFRARETGRVAWACLAGAASMAAIAFKQVAFWNALLVFWLLLRPHPRRARLFGASSIGGLVVVAATCLPFLLTGAWRPFWDCVIGHNLRYAGLIPWSSYPNYASRALGNILPTTWPIWLFAALGIVLAMPTTLERGPSPSERSHAGGLILWLGLSVLGVSTGGFFRNHYFFQLAPALALLAGWAAARLPGLTPWRSAQRLLAAGTAVILIQACLVASAWYYQPGDPSIKSRALYGFNPFVESAAVATLVSQSCAPDERVFILGSEPQILFLSGRRSASRFIFAYPYSMPLPDARQRQLEVIQELRAQPPRVIVTIFAPPSFCAGSDTPGAIFHFTRTLLDTSYELVGAAPFLPPRTMRLVTGPEVRELWRRAPVWYDTATWCSLAIWRRTDRPVREITPSVKH